MTIAIDYNQLQLTNPELAPAEERPHLPKARAIEYDREREGIQGKTDGVQSVSP